MRITSTSSSLRFASQGTSAAPARTASATANPFSVNSNGPVQELRPLICSHQWHQGALARVKNPKSPDDPESDIFVLSVPKLPEDSPLRAALNKTPNADKLAKSKLPHDWVIIPAQIAKLLPQPPH